MNNYINLNSENIDKEHVCCAIATDKKHQQGVFNKKNWLKERIAEGHVFRKLDVNGKVFIEYAPLESAWIPVSGEKFIYIYCLWVAGSYKEKGYAKELLQYAINDAKVNGKNGVCVLTSKKKKPYLSEKKFFEKFGFKVVDEIDDYELLALMFNNESPKFNDSVKLKTVKEDGLVIYYSNQCPYVTNCIKEIKDYCSKHIVTVKINEVNSVKMAKEMPCIFNNWAVFYNGNYISNMLLNANMLDKLLLNLNK